MLLRIALIIMTLMVLISTSAFAATSKKGEKDTSVALRGESKVGDGYKLFFDKKKKSSLHVHGFTRLYMYFTEDPDKNLRMPYFRFYVDGQKDEHWAFHSRFDYRQGHFSNSNSGALSNANGGTTPGIYFARAYTTYTYNENFKIDAGRNINFHHKYDVLALAELEVGLGFFPRFKYGNFSFDMSYIYMDESQRMSPADEPEASYYGGRVSYSVKASKDFKIDMGLGFNGSHMEDVAEYRQFTPDLTFNLPCDSWILNQFMWRKYTDNIKPVIENCRIAKANNQDGDTEYTNYRLSLWCSKE